MKRTSFRQGSALLIVLGMVAFMVVSAVGFSVFMRESRRPSSHLRRNITSRFLLRAALANAIARLDGEIAGVRDDDDEIHYYVEGVYDDPYPGVGPSLNETQKMKDEHKLKWDGRELMSGGHWDKRVFMPFGPVNPMYTVSTLTLESLAYLPPAIINEVRVWSRQTLTAEWKNLAYDLGRYAFCAVDVSDCFDINKVRANERRSSAANHRFNLSSLYPDNAQQLDEVLDKVVNQDPPSFISLADFNIVAGKGCPFAPWMDYIGKANEQIYSRSNHQTVSNALFITDTWFPPTNTVGSAAAMKTYNLEAGGRNQPWTDFNLNSFEDALEARNSSSVGEALYGMLQGIGLACLYDYLDEDQVPLSYCLPCTETSPMVCALGIDQAQTSVKVSYREEQVDEGDFGQLRRTGSGDEVYEYHVTVTRCSLKVDASELAVDGVLAFPFKRAHLKRDYPKNFDGDALVRVFFGPGDARCRLAAVGGGRGGDMVHPLPGRTWDNEPRGAWNKGVFTCYVPRIGISSRDLLTRQIKEQPDALEEFKVIAEVSGDLTLFYRVEKKANPRLPGLASETWYSFDGMKDDADAFFPRDKNGKVCDWWAADYLDGKDGKGYKSDKPIRTEPGGYYGSDPALLPSGSGRNSLHGLEVYPHVAVWTRLYNGNDTYDIVPARPDDDEIYGRRDRPHKGDGGEWNESAGGEDNAPILAFRDRAKITLVESELAAAFPASDGALLTFDAAWNRLYVADPRYNYAPENWFVVSDDGEMKEGWLNAVSSLFGKDGRDRDIFMFTSDQEYLQSIGELAFLPRVGEPNQPFGRFTRYYRDNSHFAPDDSRFGAPFANRASADSDQLCQSELFWRTYTGYDNGYDSDNDSRVYTLYEDERPCEIVSGVNDFRANPFSQDERIMAAVVRDTPFDYFAASTNELNSLFSEPDKATPADVKKAKCVFTEDDSSSAGYVKGFSRLAAGMRQKFADGAHKSSAATSGWLGIYDSVDFGWRYGDETGDDQVHLFGVELDEPLHGVDRKFLYAYWRECFQNRQQLFLLFLRAEPLTVGGMGFGSLAAAQLGSRGVALVWRDPEPPARGRAERMDRIKFWDKPNQWREKSNESGPHRTRVLFYHPID